MGQEDREFQELGGAALGRGLAINLPDMVNETGGTLRLQHIAVVALHPAEEKQHLI